VAIRHRLERSCSKLRTSVRHEGQPARVRSNGCEPGAESCRVQRVLMTTGRLQRLVTGAFPSPAGRASARRVTDWDKHDAAAHKSPDRRAAQACDKGVPVVRTTANVVLRAATSSFKLGSIQPKAFRVANSQALTGRRASGSGWVGAHLECAATRVEASGQPTGRHGTSDLAAEPRLSQPKGAEGHRGVKARRSVRTQVKLARLKTASSHCAQGGAKPRRRTRRSRRYMVMQDTD
jgi:hypothetical protein